MYCDKKCSYGSESVFYRSINPENNPYIRNSGADIYADMMRSKQEKKEPCFLL